MKGPSIHHRHPLEIDVGAGELGDDEVDVVVHAAWRIVLVTASVVQPRVALSR